MLGQPFITHPPRSIADLLHMEITEAARPAFPYCRSSEWPGLEEHRASFFIPPIG